MCSAADDGRSTETLALTATSASTGGRRARSRRRCKPPKDGGPTLVLAPGPSSCVELAHPYQSNVEWAAQGFELSDPENVESLAKYKPRRKTYRVSLIFSGEAGSVMDELMTELEVDNPNEVIKPALALLLSARGKEILLRDPKTGVVGLVEF
jgi:hypothetical protein